MEDILEDTNRTPLEVTVSVDRTQGSSKSVAFSQRIGKHSVRIETYDLTDIADESVQPATYESQIAEGDDKTDEGVVIHAIQKTVEKIIDEGTKYKVVEHMPVLFIVEAPDPWPVEEY